MFAGLSNQPYVIKGLIFDTNTNNIVEYPIFKYLFLNSCVDSDVVCIMSGVAPSRLLT